MATVSASEFSGVIPILADEDRFEVVHGQRVELPPMSAYASIIASRLLIELGVWCKAKAKGRAVSETLFRLSLASGEVQRRPDVAFVSYDRWPQKEPVPKDEAGWNVVPDVAVEVISPTDRAEDVLEKIEEYFQAGALQVWVVYPRRIIIHIYESLSQIHGLTHGDELKGGNVLPDFHLALADLFSDGNNSNN